MKKFYNRNQFHPLFEKKNYQLKQKISRKICMDMALRNPIFRAKIEVKKDEIPTRYFGFVVRRYES